MNIDPVDGAIILDLGIDESGIQNVRIIPQDAIATYGALLGLDDPSEIVEAINTIRDQPDPGVELWAETETALIAALDEAQAEAVTTGKTNNGNIGKGQDVTAGQGVAGPSMRAQAMRSPKALAAQGKARSRLGIPDPGKHKTNPALQALKKPDYTAAVAAKRDAWLASITPVRRETKETQQ